MNSSEIKDGTIYEKKAMILLGTGKKCGSGNQVHTWNDLEETRKKRTFRYEGDGNNDLVSTWNDLECKQLERSYGSSVNNELKSG